MKPLITILLLLSLTATAQLDGHTLYKVEYGDQFSPDSAQVNGTMQSLLFILANFGGQTSSTNMFNADSYFVADLSQDGQVATYELTSILGTFGNLLWSQGDCQGSIFDCWAVSYPGMMITVTYNLPGSPWKMVRTSNPNANWWWIE